MAIFLFKWLNKIIIFVYIFWVIKTKFVVNTYSITRFWTYQFRSNPSAIKINHTLPHIDTSVAFKQAIHISIPCDGDEPTWLYINTGLQFFNATQEHKPNYTTSYISIPNDGDNSTCLSNQSFSLIICTS